MGNFNSNIQMNYIEELKTEKLKDYKDPRYGNIKVYKNPKNPKEQILLKEKWANDLNEEIKINTLLERFKNIKHFNLFKLIHKNKKELNHFCSSFSKFYIIFEYNENDLKKEILSKKDSDRTDYFSEPEIWYTLETLINIEKELMTMDYIHGDIQPSTCHVTDSGYIRLLDNTVINNGLNAYDKCLNNKRYRAPLSPKALAELKDRIPKSTCDAVKEDSWAIGMTIFCTALVKDFTEFYDFKEFKINFNKINKSYDYLLNQGYSQQLVATIKSILNEQESQRTDINQLYEFLLPYKEDIANKQLDFNKKEKILESFNDRSIDNHLNINRNSVPEYSYFDENKEQYLHWDDGKKKHYMKNNDNRIQYV